MTESPEKLKAIPFLIPHIYEYGYRNILSLGAGESVPELLLAQAMPETSRVVATDYNPYIVNHVKEFFTDITALEFDFTKTHPMDIKKEVRIDFDLVLMFRSSCIMDNEEFVRLFSQLKEIGARQIIDFQHNYISPRYMVEIAKTFFLMNLKKSTTLRKLFSKPPLPENPRKYYAYLRSASLLRKLYRQSGLHLREETSAGVYPYIAICDC